MRKITLIKSNNKFLILEHCTFVNYAWALPETHMVNIQFGAIPFVIHAEGFVRELDPLRGTYRGPVSQRYISSQRYIPNNVRLKKRNRLHFMTGASLRLGPGKNCEFPARFSRIESGLGERTLGTRLKN